MFNRFKTLFPLIFLAIILYISFNETGDWFWLIVGTLIILVVGFFAYTDDRDTPLIIEETQFSMKHITKMKTIQYADIKRVTIEFDKRNNISPGVNPNYVYLKIMYKEYGLLYIPQIYVGQYKELIRALQNHPHIHISETILTNEEHLVELVEQWIDRDTRPVNKVVTKGFVEDYAKENDLSLHDAKFELIKHGIKEVGCLFFFFIAFIIIMVILTS